MKFTMASYSFVLKYEQWELKIVIPGMFSFNMYKNSTSQLSSLAFVNGITGTSHTLTDSIRNL